MIQVTTESAGLVGQHLPLQHRRPVKSSVRKRDLEVGAAQVDMVAISASAEAKPSTL